MTPASRNPFRAERIDALRWRPDAAGLTAEAVVERFRARGWRGAIVGPHGTGKSTLLRLLADAAEVEGASVWRVFVNRDTPRRKRRPTPPPVATVWAIDGWCHLSPAHRWALRGTARRGGVGMLGTAHLCGWGLPVVHRTRASPELLAALVAELDRNAAVDAPCLLAAARGSVRDALLALYDREAGRRPREPRPAKPSRSRPAVVGSGTS